MKNRNYCRFSITKVVDYENSWKIENREFWKYCWIMKSSKNMSYTVDRKVREFESSHSLFSLIIL